MSRRDWGTLRFGYLNTGLFDTGIILQFVRHLVNGTKTINFHFLGSMSAYVYFLHEKYFLGDDQYLVL